MKDNDDLQEWRRLFKETDDREAFWRLVMQSVLYGRLKQEHFEALQQMITTKEEVKTMLEAVIAEDRQTYFEQGLLHGKIKGAIEGKREGKAEDAKAMLLLGFEIDLIRKITGLPEEDLLVLQDNETKGGEKEYDT